MALATIDGHRLVALIARGAFSRVFRSLTPSGQDAAFKLLEDGNDKVRISGIKREYRFLSMLDHPGIPSAYTIGRLPDGRMYEVMQLLPGDNIRNLLRRKRNWVLGVLPTLLKTTGAALAAVHEKSLVHCDVKPENIVVGPDGRGYLVDFASTHGPGDWYRFWEKIPQEASPSYISPEQVAGGKPTRASDAYALGVIVFEILAGRPPFTGMSVKALYEAHLKRPAPSLETLVPGVSRDLAKLAALPLEKSPSRRPVSVHQWCHGVAGCVERLRMAAGVQQHHA